MFVKYCTSILDINVQKERKKWKKKIWLFKLGKKQLKKMREKLMIDLIYVIKLKINN